MKTFFLTFKSIITICCLCFSINIQAQLAGNYTIDSSSARSSTNFQSFSDLTAALDSHGVSAPIIVDVVVGSGPYNEQVLFTTYTGVSAVNTITINGNGEILGFNQNTNHGRVISIDSSKHITIDSLHIQTGHNTSGTGVHFMRHADSNTVKNCIIDLSSITSHPSFNIGTASGIAVSRNNHPTGFLLPGRANYLTIINNQIIGDSLSSGGPTVGIYLYGINSVGNLIKNNLIKNWQKFGIVANSQDSMIISDNIMSRNKPGVASGTGILFGESSQNCYVQNNKITGVVGGIGCSNNQFKYNDQNYIINNVIYNNRTKEGTGISVTNSHGVNVLHNTISFDDTTTVNYFYSGATRGIIASGGYITIKNNNVNISNNGDGRKIGIEIGNNSSNMIFDYNNIYVFSNSNVDQYYGQLSSARRYSTLAEWKTVNASNNNAQNSTSLDPLFRNPQNLVPSNIYLNNTGENLGVLEDINQNQRDSIPDVGAFEFDSSATMGINYPFYPVGQINTEDAIGFPDSSYLRCRTSGTIVGIDLDPSFSFQYFLIDQSLGGTQEGITLRGFDSIPGSALNEGDSVEVLGTVLQKTGNPYLSVHSIRLIQSNRPPPNPIQVDSISETVAGKLVEIKNTTLWHRYFVSSNTELRILKNNILTKVDVLLVTKIRDSISFVSWAIGDTICSIKGVVAQSEFGFYPTRVGFALYPRYAIDLKKDSCGLLTNVKKHFGFEQKISVFPNPSNGNIQLRFSTDDVYNKEIKVYDLRAKLVHQEVLSNSGINHSIDLSHLKSGVYIVRLSSDVINETMKVTILE